MVSQFVGANKPLLGITLCRASGFSPLPGLARRTPSEVWKPVGADSTDVSKVLGLPKADRQLGLSFGRTCQKPLPRQAAYGVR